MATTDTRPRSALDRFLGIFAVVHSGEGLTAILLAVNVFLILTAYYILKPVREALILSEGSAELKTYMAAGQVVALAFIVPFYGKLVASRPRMRLINTVTAFFTGCLVVFYFLAKAGVPLGIPFFIWIGVFSLMIVAQFWSFANVIYDKAEGERLFAIVGFGASLGAVAGSQIADVLIEPVGDQPVAAARRGLCSARRSCSPTTSITASASTSSRTPSRCRRRRRRQRPAIRSRFSWSSRPAT